MAKNKRLTKISAIENAVFNYFQKNTKFNEIQFIRHGKDEFRFLTLNMKVFVPYSCLHEKLLGDKLLKKVGSKIKNTIKFCERYDKLHPELFYEKNVNPYYFLITIAFCKDKDMTISVSYSFQQDDIIDNFLGGDDVVLLEKEISENKLFSSLDSLINRIHEFQYSVVQFLDRQL